jgi:hypothetical protein
MIDFYNWFICKLFKQCQLEVKNKALTPFERYCKENPWAAEAKMFDL